MPIAIVTVSDTRTPETTNAAYLREQIATAGHRVVGYRIIKDEADQVAALLDELAESEARVILFIGGTGICTATAPYDALSRKLEKVPPGFGELFRMLSYPGGRSGDALRATAGIYRNKVIISTPGRLMPSSLPGRS